MVGSHRPNLNVSANPFKRVCSCIHALLAYANSPCKEKETTNTFLLLEYTSADLPARLTSELAINCRVGEHICVRLQTFSKLLHYLIDFHKV